MSVSAQNKNESSNHIEAFFEYATMGILVTDSSGKITAINPCALKEFGYSEKELIGKELETLIPSRFYNTFFISSDNHRSGIVKQGFLKGLQNF